MMTSMRKTAVVRMAATVPKPRVRKEGRRAERPLEPRRSMKREMRRAMNVMPQAMGWRTSAAVRALLSASRLSSRPRISRIWLSTEKPSLGREQLPSRVVLNPNADASAAPVQYPQTPNVTSPLAEAPVKLSSNCAFSLNRKIVLIIGTDSDTRRRSKNAMKRRMGARKVIIVGASGGGREGKKDVEVR